MHIIYNKYIPFGSFTAINLCGIVFAKKRHGQLDGISCNHEYIHTMQQREMLFLPFYVWYILEWMIHMIRHRNLKKAYRAISFEREAYHYQHDLNYRNHRKPFSWVKFVV